MVEPAPRNRKVRRTSLGRIAIPAAAILSATLGACVSVEIDRMSGTTFPPELMMNGQNVTISSVYLEAGRVVNVNEDESNIPELAIPNNDCISDAELDALEAGHRDSPLFPTGTTYHLYAAIVNHYGEVLDACSPGWLTGKLWDAHTRSALAIFYLHPSIQPGSEEYLRTTIHEIGHAMNLHHQDGDPSTIMTQSDDVVDPVFEFSADSVEHLQNHPAVCKYPGAVGGAPFTWVTNDHAAWHVQTVPNCN